MRMRAPEALKGGGGGLQTPGRLPGLRMGQMDMRSPATHSRWWGGVGVGGGGGDECDIELRPEHPVSNTMPLHRGKWPPMYIETAVILGGGRTWNHCPHTQSSAQGRALPRPTQTWGSLTLTAHGTRIHPHPPASGCMTPAVVGPPEAARHQNGSITPAVSGSAKGGGDPHNACVLRAGKP